MSVDTWKYPSTQCRRDKVVLWTGASEVSNLRLSKCGLILQRKPELGRGLDIAGVNTDVCCWRAKVRNNMMCTRDWKKSTPTARPSLQVVVEAASQRCSTRADFKPVWQILSKCVAHLKRTPTSGDRVNALTVIYIAFNYWQAEKKDVNSGQ